MSNKELIAWFLESRKYVGPCLCTLHGGIVVGDEKNLELQLDLSV